MTEVAFSPEALADLERVWSYVAADSSRAATRLVDAINDKIDRLRDFPQLGAAHDEIRPGFRMLVHGRYLILYAFLEARNLIEIKRIIEGERDLSDAF